MGELDQGSLHPLQEKDMNRTPAAYTASEHSSKELSRQLMYNYSKHLLEASKWLPPVHMLL
jgi:hypothetical protein